MVRAFYLRGFSMERKVIVGTMDCGLQMAIDPDNCEYATGDDCVQTIINGGGQSKHEIFLNHYQSKFVKWEVKRVKSDN